MFSITVYLANASTPITLLYKAEDTARASLNLMDAATEPFRVSDDFGHELIMHPDMLGGMLIEDMNIAQMGHIELGLHHARTQAKATKAGMADPTLMASRSLMGPAVLQPGGMPMNGPMR